MNENKFDAQRGYCRRLGHDVDFSYCRIAGDGIPCFKILDCWYERFDIKAFMESNYSTEEIKNILAPPQNKVATLYDLIAKAQKTDRPQKK